MYIYTMYVCAYVLVCRALYMYMYVYIYLCLCVYVSSVCVIQNNNDAARLYCEDD